MGCVKMRHKDGLTDSHITTYSLQDTHGQCRLRGCGGDDFVAWRTTFCKNFLDRKVVPTSEDAAGEWCQETASRFTLWS